MGKKESNLGILYDVDYDQQTIDVDKEVERAWRFNLETAIAYTEVRAIAQEVFIRALKDLPEAEQSRYYEYLASLRFYVADELNGGSFLEFNNDSRVYYMGFYIDEAKQPDKKLEELKRPVLALDPYGGCYNQDLDLITDAQVVIAFREKIKKIDKRSTTLLRNLRSEGLSDEQAAELERIFKSVDNFLIIRPHDPNQWLQDTEERT